MDACKVIIADDHALFRQGIKRIINDTQSFRVIGEACDGLKLLELLKNTSADMVILDISMPNFGGIEATKEIKRIHPHLKVVILTMHTKIEYLRQAISAGADGYILKEDTDEELIHALNKVKRDQMHISHALFTEMENDFVRVQKYGQWQTEDDILTIREKQILKLIAEGKKNKTIASLLFISIRTVENHRAKIMRKLRFKNLADLINYAIKKGYINSH